MSSGSLELLPSWPRKEGSSQEEFQVSWKITEPGERGWWYFPGLGRGALRGVQERVQEPTSQLTRTACMPCAQDRRKGEEGLRRVS